MKTRTHQSRIGATELVYYLLGILILLLAAVVGKGRSQTEAQAQLQHQLYRDYRGVRLGMTAIEVRATLGEPAMKSNEQDFYVLSPNETAQVAYDATQKVVTISTDYTGVLAPLITKP